MYRYLTGGAWGRTFFATGLAQGNDPIRVEPIETRRLPAINQLDLHVEKTLRLGSRQLGGFVDVFNVSNQGVPDSEVAGSDQLELGSELGRAVSLARAAAGAGRGAADVLGLVA